MDPTAIWFDESGEPCDPRQAVTGEITEYSDEGDEIKRTYVDRRLGATQPGGEVDYDVEAADTLKFGTWDLYAVVDGIWTLAETLPQLLLALNLEAADLATRRQAVGDFMGLPAWVPAPQALKDETYAWLVATRP